MGLNSTSVRVDHHASGCAAIASSFQSQRARGPRTIALSMTEVSVFHCLAGDVENDLVPKGAAMAARRLTMKLLCSVRRSGWCAGGAERLPPSRQYWPFANFVNSASLLPGLSNNFESAGWLPPWGVYSCVRKNRDEGRIVISDQAVRIGHIDKRRELAERGSMPARAVRKRYIQFYGLWNMPLIVGNYR